MILLRHGVSNKSLPSPTVSSTQLLNAILPHWLQSDMSTAQPSCVAGQGTASSELVGSQRTEGIMISAHEGLVLTSGN